MYTSPSLQMQSELHSDMAVYGKGAKQQKKDSFARSIINWIHLKNYQYEVTFSLYMLTYREKIIFNLVLLSLASMIAIAMFLYLPNHVSIINRRVWYYVEGSSVSTTLVDAVKTTRAALSYTTAGVSARQATEHLVTEL